MLVITFGHLAAGQSFTQSTLTWSADQAIDIERGDTTVLKCTFTTSGNNQFVWSQRNGSLNSTYQVTSVEGSWENVNAPGSITLNLLRNGKATKAVFQRTIEGVSLTLEYANSPSPSHIRFRIVHVD